MNTAIIKYGITALVALVLSSSYLIDGPDELQASQDADAALRDALQQAQAERPDLWTPERKARADAAAGMVAKRVQ